MTTSKGLMKKWGRERPLTPLRLFSDDICYLLAREDINIFIDCMTRLHCQHLKADIDHYIESTSEKMVDKLDLQKKMVDKWSIKPSLAEKMVDILLDCITLSRLLESSS